MDFTGIENGKEYFTTHYFYSLAKEDIERQTSLWKEKRKEGERLPHERLVEVGKGYFHLLDSYRGEEAAADRIELQRTFFQKLFSALGYRMESRLYPLDSGLRLPLRTALDDEKGAPLLWIVEVLQEPKEFEGPLELSLLPEQYGDEEASPPRLPLEEIISSHIFNESSPPRWLIVAAIDRVILIDRTKWARGSSLQFDLEAIFESGDNSTAKALAALLHAESLTGTLYDTMHSNSARHAAAVSGDLKHAIRESIELLANEAVYYLKNERRVKVYDTELAEKLSVECLRYMYKLLFIFYLEARPELGYTPDKSEIYLKGYSIEALRDLEQVKLYGEEAQNGYFLQESIELLFKLIQNGTKNSRERDLFIDEKSIHDTFTLAPLASTLFDPENTPTLNKVKFRNHILQEVIRGLSLTRREDKRKGRGRISYSSLSINELGEAYETLLSFRGFFAESDLYEVKEAKEKFGDLGARYFVREEELPNYRDSERLDGEGRLVKHERGRFIFCISGRNRQLSGSYYTPKKLTEFLVKRSLKLLIEGKSADELLELTICEPAMGSGAFLNEAVDQLAEAYLEKKQKECKQAIPSEKYLVEKQRVKMLLSDNNIFGVDLNATAVELAEVSLWLNSIYSGAHVPWFGMQIARGNSLVGARREVVTLKTASSRKKFASAERVRLLPGCERAKESVYHFLLPADGMGDYASKEMKALLPNSFADIARWKKEFFSPLSGEEVALAMELSHEVDRLLESHRRELKNLRARYKKKSAIFGREKGFEEPIPLKEKEKRWRDYLANPAGSYRKLKLAMDYWCALWYWPLLESSKLPTRGEWFAHLSLLLGRALPLFEGGEASEEVEQLRIAERVAADHAFFHWELHFADILMGGGFDLVIGNPPWVKVSWNEGDFLSEKNPLIALRGMSASSVALERRALLEEEGARGEFFSSFEGVDATKRFLEAKNNWPLMRGASPNLYKFFIEKALTIGKESGISALIHQPNVFDDAKGGTFRSHLYPRLEAFYHFKNSLKLFDIDQNKTFALTILRNGPKGEPSFSMAANLFDPITVEASEKHEGCGELPGIKSSDNSWNIEGHRERLLVIGEMELSLFAALYDARGTVPLKAKLPLLHTARFLTALEKLAKYPTRLGDLGDSVTISRYWDETNAQKEGTIRRETAFCRSPEEAILSAPHIGVGNPLFKTPRAVCKENGHYDPIDLMELPEDYLPRTNFLAAVAPEEYRRRSVKCAWERTLEASGCYKAVVRRWLALNSERTLQGAIAPKGAAHIDSCQSASFKEGHQLLAYASLLLSLPVDFFAKISGKKDAHPSFLKQLPLLRGGSPYRIALFVRALRLNCLTSYYGELWRDSWEEEFCREEWSKGDPRLEEASFAGLSATFGRNSALRSDYARRQALVEIDILAAMEFGMTLEELLDIYSVQFPILQKNEKNTWYDRRGRIAYTENRSLPNVGLPKEIWEEVKGNEEGEVVHLSLDDTLPGGPREKRSLYLAPFDRCSREEDYRTAWNFFTGRYGGSIS